MRITIVTVCFNAAATIGDTLASVARQQVPGLEHIIVDGGSNDATLSIVERFPHVARVISESDRGIYDAMNKGLAAASGDYIGYLNADDVFATDEALARFLGGGCPGTDIVSGDVVMVDAARPGRIVRTYRGGRFTPKRLRIGDMPPHPATYIRTTAMRAVGGFRDDFRIAGDFDLLARLILGRGASWAHRSVTVTAMRLGGVSTASPGHRQQINREIRRALSDLGLAAPTWVLSARYFGKIRQYLGRPADLPQGWVAEFGVSRNPAPGSPNVSG